MPAPFMVIAILCVAISNSNSVPQEKYEQSPASFRNLNNANHLAPSHSAHQPPLFWPPSSAVSELATHQVAAAHGPVQASGRSPPVRPANNQVSTGARGEQAHEPWRYQTAVGQDLRSASSLSLADDELQPRHQQLQLSKQALRGHVAPYQQAEQAQLAVGGHHHQQQQSQAFFNLPSDLELALRQASGDESVFQPSPGGIAAPGHSQTFDWLARAPATRSSVTISAPQTTTQVAGPTSDPQAPAPTSVPLSTTTLTSASAFTPTSNPVSTSSPTPAKTTAAAAAATKSTSATTTTTTTTAASTSASTEISNNLAGTAQVEPLVLSHQNSLSSQGVHQNEYETNARGRGAIEFSNQVIYEGPATAPPPQRPGPPLGDDYYFSATAGSHGQDKSNDYNSEQVNSNAWWAIGAGEEFERASNLTREDLAEYCDKSPLLVNHKQRSLCRTHHRVMAVVARGIRMAIDECQLRFAHSRWNCSVILVQQQQQQQQQHQRTDQLERGAQIASNSSPGGGQIFGDVMRHPNRERSFLNAIFAAALAHSMTKACSQGELPEECSCDRKIKSKNSKGRVEWVACSDDIDYGARFSRDFTDNFGPNELDTTMTIYMHNSEVGRRVFKSATDITCTCLNGENGLCQTKRCWKHLGSFSDVVDEIIKRYEGATHVQRSNRDPHKLRPVRRGVRRPKRKDLVYIDESPDYCQQDLRIGVLGTQNRSCNSTSQGPDSCSLLCCGRGFQTVVEHIEEDCNCKFVWCCEVKCDKCRRDVTSDVCN